MSQLVHAFSLDVEDFANGAVLLACGRVVPPTENVVHLTERMLAILADCSVKATCFLLGDVAEAFPPLVRRIADQGHEIGVHGWHHHRVFQLERDAYRSSLERAKKLLEDISGKVVRGYRAVAMSITRKTWWAYDVVAELGFSYSSSIYPFRGLRYGVPSAPVGPHYVTTAVGASVLEIPLSVITIGPLRLPALGGGYIRHFPFAYTRFALSKLEREGRPGVVYLHPYELDVDAKLDRFPIPVNRGEAKRIAQFARGQYRGREHTERKVRALLQRAAFAPLEVVFARWMEAA